MCVDDFKFEGLEKLFVFIMYLVTKFGKNPFVLSVSSIQKKHIRGSSVFGWEGRVQNPPPCYLKSDSSTTPRLVADTP